MNYKFQITTGCCYESLKHKVVTLNFKFDINLMGVPFVEQKPMWLAMGYKHDNYGISESSVEVSCCPFCGIKVPDIEINNEALTKKVHDSEDGDYCDTCGNRNMECNCLPPWFRWKPIGVNITLPNIENDDVEI